MATKAKRGGKGAGIKLPVTQGFKQSKKLQGMTAKFDAPTAKKAKKK